MKLCRVFQILVVTERGGVVCISGDLLNSGDMSGDDQKGVLQVNSVYDVLPCSTSRSKIKTPPTIQRSKHLLNE